jgi:prepilin-type N-terminal cleavage/methylation domain-containing protein
MDRKRTRGFTLLELLIVVSIILILAVIATPSFISALQSSRETSAVATLKQIYQAEMIYVASYSSFGPFDSLVASGGIDNRFGTEGGDPILGGYQYSIILAEDGSGFYVQADPVGTASGRYDYYIGLDGVARYRTALGNAVPGADVQ